MPRKHVPLEIGEQYHVYNRGVDKRIIFHDPQDYLRFYQSLYLFNSVEPTLSLRSAKKQSYERMKKLVDITAYALVNNHFHLIATPLTDNGLSLFMKRVSVGYTGYYNDKYHRSGVLFQGSFKRVHISADEQRNYLSTYVHYNHAVHNAPEPKHIYQSSSLHLEKKYKSKLITNSLNQVCDANESKALAKQIYKERLVRYRELCEL